MKPTAPPRAALLLGVLLSSACIDDPAGPDDGIPLSEAEAELLGLQVFRQALIARLETETQEQRVLQPGGPVAAPVDISDQVSFTIPCDQGGDIASEILLAGTVDDQTGLGSLTLTITQRHEDCAVEDQGVAFLLTGDPGITTTIRATAEVPGVVALTGTMRGAVDAWVDGNVGRCEVNVAIAGVEVEGQASAYTMSGSVCGEDVDTQTTTTAGTA